MLANWHIGLIRAYEPASDIDWLNVSFEHHAWTKAFTNEALEREFVRFSNRDMVMVGVTIGFCGAIITYPSIFPDQYGPIYMPLMYVVGFSGLLLSAASVYLISYGDFTQAKGFCRAVVTVLLALVVANGCATSDTPFFARCEKTRDFLDFLPNNHHSYDNYVHDCIRIIDAYLIIPFVTAMSMANLHPAAAFAMCLVTFGLSYSGYANTDYNFTEAGETPKELLLKLLVYVAVFVSTVVLFVFRYLSLRRQFEAAVRAHAQSLLTKKKSEDVDALLCAMVPLATLGPLMSGETISDATDNATVLFSDMVQFTAWSAVRPTRVVVAMLNTLCIQLDRLAKLMSIEKVKTIGDAYWAVTGLPTEMLWHADTMVRFGLKMHRIVAKATQGKAEWGHVRLRVGINSGPARGAIFGTSRLSYEVYGPTSDVAEECEKNGFAERVCISEATRRLLSPCFSADPYRSIQTEHGPIALFLVQKEVLASGTRDKTGGYDAVSIATSLGSDRSGSASQSGVKANGEHMRRRQFIEQRAARKAELEMQIEDPADIERRVSKRHFEWVLLHFADPDVERQYQEFAFEKTVALRRATRAIMVMLVCLQFIIGGADEHTGVPTASWVLLAITLCIVVALFGHAFSPFAPRRLEEFVLFAAVTLDVIAIGLVSDNLIGNDTLYVISFCSAVFCNGTTALPWVAYVSFFLTLAVPILYFSYNSVMFTTSFAFVLFIGFVVMLGVVTMEKQLRRQFIEQLVQDSKHKVQLAREAEQRALLEAIVPSHVIQPLQQWLEQDLDVNKTIAQQFDAVPVGFFHIEPHSDDLPTKHSDTDAHQWLFDAHNRIDEAIAAQHGAFDKIKTIGSKVMIAGNFKGTDASVEAGLAMIRCFLALRQQGLNIRAGFHVGEVMGAVLGTERLCFDIFGDTVNVASRVLTTLEHGEVAGVSQEFYDLVWSNAVDAGDAVELPSVSAPITRAAKGKGVMTVRVLLLP